jgi:hypothetical protein
MTMGDNADVKWRWGWLTAVIAVALFMLYPLSMGPALVLAPRYETVETALVVYDPLFKLESYSHSFSYVIRRYLRLWGLRVSIPDSPRGPNCGR